MMAVLGPSVSCSTPAGAQAEAPVAVEEAAPQTETQEASVSPTEVPQVAGEQPEPADASPAATLLAQGRSLDERIAAAEALLAIGDDDACAVLIAALQQDGEAAACDAVMLAITEYDEDPPAPLAQPVADWIARVDDATEARWQRALQRFGGWQVAESLAAVARDGEQSLGTRELAIRSLGRFHGQAAAAELIGLLELPSPQIQAAAIRALAALSGMDQIGRDVEGWRQWWAQAQSLSAARWRDHLIDNFATREQQRRQQKQLMEQRLVESQRALYRAAPADQRPDLLTQMLADPLATIRQLAMELAVQRLVDDLPFDEPLLAALRERLADPLPDVRQRATLLLRDLADVPAARIVAQRLADGAETDLSAQRANLLMMTRLPQPDGVSSVLADLDHPQLRGEAAGAAAAAIEAGLLTTDQVDVVAEQVRSKLDGEAPEPQVVTLLARIGTARDWKLITRWLGHSQDGVKQAAAHAWAESDQPLDVLLKYYGDPVIDPVLLVAAARRGQGDPLLLALASRRPTGAGTDELWQRALLAVAGRVSGKSLYQAAEVLLADGELLPLVDRLLTVGLDRSDVQPATVAQLLLMRAQVRWRLDDPAQAAIDYERAATMASHMDAAQRQALFRGRLRALLQLGEIDQALTVAREGVASGAIAANGDDVVRIVLEMARRLGANGRKPEAQRMLRDVRELFGKQADKQLIREVALLEAELAGATTPAVEAEPQQDEGGESAPEASPATGSEPAAVSAGAETSI